MFLLFNGQVQKFRRKWHCQAKLARTAEAASAGKAPITRAAEDLTSARNYTSELESIKGVHIAERKQGWLVARPRRCEEVAAQVVSCQAELARAAEAAVADKEAAARAAEELRALREQLRMQGAAAAAQLAQVTHLAVLMAR